jgi:hypothetical protein
MKQQILRNNPHFFDYFVREMTTIKVSALYSGTNDTTASRHGFSRLVTQYMVNPYTFPRI